MMDLTNFWSTETGQYIAMWVFLMFSAIIVFFAIRFFAPKKEGKNEMQTQV